LHGFLIGRIPFASDYKSAVLQIEICSIISSGIFIKPGLKESFGNQPQTIDQVLRIHLEQVAEPILFKKKTKKGIVFQKNWFEQLQLQLWKA
jgi:hypothetical protein